MPPGTARRKPFAGTGDRRVASGRRGGAAVTPVQPNGLSPRPAYVGTGRAGGKCRRKELDHERADGALRAERITNARRATLMRVVIGGRSSPGALFGYLLVGIS